MKEKNAIIKAENCSGQTDTGKGGIGETSRNAETSSKND
jgi:hypothetical protein